MNPSEAACASCGLPGKTILHQQGDLPLWWSQTKIRPRKHAAGAVLFHEGDEPQAVFCIKSGMIKIFRLGSRGEPHIFRLVGPGHLIGYRAILAGDRNAATGEVVKDAEVCTIPKLLFLELLQNSRAASMRMMQHVARELRVSEDQLIAQAQQTVLERTIRLLALFLDESAMELRENVPLRFPLLRSEMAQMIGTSPETLSRALHRLAVSGLLELTRKEIYVRDPARLRAFVAAPPPGED